MKTRFMPSWAELEQFNKVKKLDKFTGSTAEYVSSYLILKLIKNAYSHGKKVSFPREWLRLKHIPKQGYTAWYNYYENSNRSKEQRGVEYLSFVIKPDLDPSARDLLSGEEEDD